MESGQTQRRIKIENPESPQADSRHQQDIVVGEPSINGLTSPVPQVNSETEVTPRRIKLENSSSTHTGSRHCFQDTVSGDQVVSGFTSHVPQVNMEAGENQERIKVEIAESPRIDTRHQPDNVVSEPSMNGFTSPVLQKKRRTGEIGSHHTDLPVFPYASFPQRQPIQTPNFPDFPYWGMQPNPNHLSFYSQFNPRMMPNYPHSFNSQVFPSTNGFTWPNELMTTYPNRFYPTTLNYSPHQNMPPNYQFPFNFQVPMRPLTNGSYPFYQPTLDNSAWWNFPNPGRSF